MSSPISRRIGGACGVVGAAGIFLGNFLHPFPPAERGPMLALVASEPWWSPMHFITMFFAVAILVFLVMLADTVTIEPAATLARVGRVVAQVGVPVMLVGVAIDGYGFKVLAGAWSIAPEAERSMLLHAADAVVVAETAIVHSWVTFFLGVTFVLYGLALRADRDYPSAWGWLGVVAGLGCVASGAAGFLRLPLTMPFPVFGTAVLGWTAGVGIMMYRRATR